MRNRKQNQGFTLIELLIVIAIIGILAAVLIPNLLAARNRANDSATQAYVRQCITAIETARDSVTQELPTTTNCEDGGDEALGEAALVLPSAVTSSAVRIDVASDSYEVDGLSTTDKTFSYDGTSITEPEFGVTSMSGTQIQHFGHSKTSETLIVHPFLRICTSFNDSRRWYHGNSCVRDKDFAINQTPNSGYRASVSSLANQHHEASLTARLFFFI